MSRLPHALAVVTIGAAAYLALGAIPAPATPAPTLPAELGARPRARESTLALARYAIAVQTITPPADFTAGLAWSAPYVHDYWRGRVWICDPTDVLEPTDPATLSTAELATLRAAALDPHTENDVCFALVDDAHGRAETGP